METNEAQKNWHEFTWRTSCSFALANVQKQQKYVAIKIANRRKTRDVEGRQREKGNISFTPNYKSWMEVINSPGERSYLPFFFSVFTPAFTWSCSPCAILSYSRLDAYLLAKMRRCTGTRRHNKQQQQRWPRPPNKSISFLRTILLLFGPLRFHLSIRSSLLLVIFVFLFSFFLLYVHRLADFLPWSLIRIVRLVASTCVCVAGMIFVLSVCKTKNTT